MGGAWTHTHTLHTPHIPHTYIHIPHKHTTHIHRHHTPHIYTTHTHTHHTHNTDSIHPIYTTYTHTPHTTHVHYIYTHHSPHTHHTYTDTTHKEICTAEKRCMFNTRIQIKSQIIRNFYFTSCQAGKKSHKCNIILHSWNTFTSVMLIDRKYRSLKNNNK